MATKGAISQRRQQLGVQPVVEVFHRCCRPLATQQTHGAWHFGLRVIAWDSTLENVPDTPANAKAFVYLHNQKGRSPFPQVRGVYLMECGTHAIIDAGFWPCHVGDISGAKRLCAPCSPECCCCGIAAFIVLRCCSSALAARSRSRGQAGKYRCDAHLLAAERWHRACHSLSLVSHTS